MVCVVNLYIRVLISRTFCQFVCFRKCIHLFFSIKKNNDDKEDRATEIYLNK